MNLEPNPKSRKGRKISPPAAFRFVKPAEAADLIFEEKHRRSPYLDALEQLQKAEPGTVLEFDNVGARPSIYQQARKHNIKVMFGEKSGKLYVRLQELEGPEAVVLKALADGPKSAQELGAILEREGHKEVKLMTIVGTLSDNNKAVLRDCSGVKKWKLAA